jgi:hypothetical protein
VKDGVRRTLTLEPQALTSDDARAVLQTGVDREALTHAIHVSYLFNVYDRLADSMGWHVPDKASGSYLAGAQRLLKRGYQ